MILGGGVIETVAIVIWTLLFVLIDEVCGSCVSGGVVLALIPLIISVWALVVCVGVPRLVLLLIRFIGWIRILGAVCLAIVPSMLTLLRV